MCCILSVAGCSETGYALPVERNLLQELKVGLFVLFFIALIGLAAFVLGGSSDMFEPTYKLHTWYRDVKGLKVGALVRVAGVDVGEVSSVEFESRDPTSLPVSEPDRPRTAIHVEMTIHLKFQDRIHADSAATISTVGLLGDMYITVASGSETSPVLEDEQSLRSIEALDFLAYADKATSIVENAGNISEKLNLMLGSEDAARAAKISDSLAHIEAMLREAKEGKGLLHTLVYDQGASASLKRTLANLERVSGDVAAITTEVRSGDGMANALIYGEGGDEMIAEITALADAMEGVVKDIKANDSLAHSLLYDPEKAQMVDDLQATVASLRTIVAEVEEGKGTAGLLINDPQVYEDLRALLGGARRNALLRAYVRATVERNRKEQGGAWTPPSDDPSNGGR